MRDYLEELLEELAEEGDILSLSQSVRRAVSSLGRGSQGDEETAGEIPQSALLTAPLVRGPREAEDGGMARGAEGTKESGGTLSVGFADSSPGGGALGREARSHIVRPYGMAAELVRRLRRGSTAAGYRANTPHPASVDATFPSRGRQGLNVAELDAAVRRDARRYDGEMTLY